MKTDFLCLFILIYTINNFNNFEHKLLWMRLEVRKYQKSNTNLYEENKKILESKKNYMWIHDFYTGWFLNSDSSRITCRGSMRNYKASPNDELWKYPHIKLLLPCYLISEHEKSMESFPNHPCFHISGCRNTQW